MKKILFVATVPEHFRFFHLPCFHMLREHGWQVDTVCSEAETFPDTTRQFVVPMGRNPLDPRNLRAYRQLRKIVREGGYDVVHCHTPVGGVLARLAARGLRKKGTRVIYTAHGFHFYKGAPLLNWLLFFPIEWLMSFFTDTLITINREDEARAKKHLHAKKTVYVHGVGCKLDRYGFADAQTKKAFRETLGVSESDTLLVYVAEQNTNKNQGVLIRAVKALSAEFPTLRLLLVGPDHIDGAYEALAAQLGAPVDFLGWRSDVPQILSVCDLYAASSLREGLPVNVMEAMATGLPIVAWNNRGQRALIEDGETGFLVASEAEMIEKLRLLLTDTTLYHRFSEKEKQAVAPFGLETVLSELSEIYFA